MLCYSFEIYLGLFFFLFVFSFSLPPSHPCLSIFTDSYFNMYSINLLLKSKTIQKHIETVLTQDRTMLTKTLHIRAVGSGDTLLPWGSSEQGLPVCTVIPIFCIFTDFCGLVLSITECKIYLNFQGWLWIYHFFVVLLLGAYVFLLYWPFYHYEGSLFVSQCFLSWYLFCLILIKVPQIYYVYCLHGFCVFFHDLLLSVFLCLYI